MADTRPEVELLLCCARISSPSERAAQIRAVLQKEIDCTNLLRTARAHGVIPFLYWRLSKTCLEAVPTAVLDRLRGDFHANSLRNLSLPRELLKVLDAWCKLSDESLSGTCPHSRAGLLPIPKGKEQTPHGLCGHLPHYSPRKAQ